MLPDGDLQLARGELHAQDRRALPRERPQARLALRGARVGQHRLAVGAHERRAARVRAGARALVLVGGQQGRLAPVRRHRRLAAAVLRGRRPEAVVRRTGLRHAELVLGGVLVLRLVLRLALLVLVLRRRELLLLRLAVLLLGLAVLLLRLGCAPLVLLGLLLGHAPRVPARLLMLHGRLAAAVLRLPALLVRGLAVLGLTVLGLTVLRLAVLRLPVLGLAVLGLTMLGLPVLGLPVLGLAVLVGHGRCAPRVRLRWLLLRRAPRVLRLAGRARLVRSLVLRRLLLLVGVVLRCRLVRLAVLPRGPVLLAALGALRRVSLPLLVVVPARPLLPVGAAAGARQVGPAAHAEQVARLERLVTDRTVQGRHDTSPERTPARSSIDVSCSMSPLRGIPM
ncbi:hypothetical protein GCM10010208_67160 [Actinomadura livida]|nr:hypothetical protein GCM10010208_67160 [Actinomadura livida]